MRGRIPVPVKSAPGKPRAQAPHVAKTYPPFGFLTSVRGQMLRRAQSYASTSGDAASRSTVATCAAAFLASFSTRFTVGGPRNFSTSTTAGLRRLRTDLNSQAEEGSIKFNGVPVIKPVSKRSFSSTWAARSLAGVPILASGKGTGYRYFTFGNARSDGDSSSGTSDRTSDEDDSAAGSVFGVTWFDVAVFLIAFEVGRQIATVFCLYTVEGPSMIPTLHEGDVILCADWEVLYALRKKWDSIIRPQAPLSVPEWMHGHVATFVASPGERLCKRVLRAPPIAAGPRLPFRSAEEQKMIAQQLHHSSPSVTSGSAITSSAVMSSSSPSTSAHDEVPSPSQENEEPKKQTTPKRPSGGMMEEGACVWMLGDNAPESHDSRHFGAVPLGAVRHVVVKTIWPPTKWFSSGQPLPEGF